jgi:hypothetical protein
MITSILFSQDESEDKIINLTEVIVEQFSCANKFKIDDNDYLIERILNKEDKNHLTECLKLYKKLNKKTSFVKVYCKENIQIEIIITI